MKQYDFRTSDLHFGHQNIIGYCNRPFADVPEMNEAMVELWNETVSPNDSVLVAGDLCMGHIVESLEYVKRLNGNIDLMPGNHDRVHSMYAPQAEKYERFWKMYTEAGLNIVPEQLSSMIGDHFVVECHFPYVGDHTEDQRYSEYRPINEGLWLLHGHIHDEWKVRDNMINVGVDVWDFRPVHTDQIKELMGV